MTTTNQYPASRITNSISAPIAFLLALIAASSPSIADEAGSPKHKAVSLAVGGDYPLCHVIARIVADHMKSPAAICQIPSKIEALGPIKWMPLDPRANIDIVKRVFAWNVARMPDYRTETYLRDLRNPNFLSDDRIEEEWKKFGTSLEQLVTAQKISLQLASIPLVPSRAPVGIYRMTQVWPTTDSIRSRPTWFVHACSGAATPNDANTWDYLINAAQADWMSFTEINDTHLEESVLVSLSEGVYRVNFWDMPSFARGITVKRYLPSGYDQVTQDNSRFVCNIEVR